MLSLSVVGLFCGLLAGAVVLALRWTIESAQDLFLPAGEPEAYEGLAPWVRLALSTAGGLAIGLFLAWTPRAARSVGVVHLLERMAYHQGRLPLRNALTQFIGAAVAIISGQSVGREGPGVHLGAAAASQIGMRLQMPNNALRTLVACGASASIAAAFNTPLAGVIFAVEVLIMEYVLHSLVPVILAAVAGATLAHVFYGPDPAFQVPPLTLGSLGELPLVVLLGLAVGVLAATFTRTLLFFARRTRPWPVWLRTTVAGGLTGVCAFWVPEIMGIGYDTVNAALLGQLGLATLLGIAAFKLFATAAGIGMGLPGGLIGPTLVIGAAAGGAVGVLAGAWAGGEVSPSGFYAVLGSCAMMGATLQAPLAALTGLLELTYDPHIVTPGLLAVISASLASAHGLRTQSVFMMAMRADGLDVRNDPIAQSLRRQGVSAVMERRVAALPRRPSRSQARAALADGEPRWILIEEGRQTLAALAAADLAHALGELLQDEVVDLLEVPGDRRNVAAVGLEATLQEALEQLHGGAELLYVTRVTAPGVSRIYGVLTREDIERGYRL